MKTEDLFKVRNSYNMTSEDLLKECDHISVLTTGNKLTDFEKCLVLLDDINLKIDEINNKLKGL